MLEDFNEAVPVSKPATTGNTVMGHPERVFRQAWIMALSHAMLKSGKGFRMDPLKRTGGERRADKVGTTKLSRRLLTGAA